MKNINADAAAMENPFELQFLKRSYFKYYKSGTLNTLF